MILYWIITITITIDVYLYRHPAIDNFIVTVKDTTSSASNNGKNMPTYSTNSNRKRLPTHTSTYIDFLLYMIISSDRLW